MNEDATTRLIRELREEILALRAELTAVKSVGAGAGGGGSVPAGPPLSPAEAAAAEATRAAELESKLRRASAIAEMLSSISEAAAEDDGASTGSGDSALSPLKSPAGRPLSSRRDPTSPNEFNGLRQALVGRQMDRRQSISRGQMESMEVRLDTPMPASLTCT